MNEHLVASCDLVVTTYGLVIRDVDALREMAWRRVVLGAAQAVRTRRLGGGCGAVFFESGRDQIRDQDATRRSLTGRDG